MSVQCPKWLGPLNFYVLQWFFVRLSIEYNEEDTSDHYWFKWIKGVIPMTGWWSNYKYLWKQKKE